MQEDLGTRTLGTGTYFVDPADGITVAIGANTITVINDVAAAFANGAFNGPDLVFSGVNILSAAIDPVSAADFLGAVSSTSDSIAINFSGLNPALGHALVIDVGSSVPEPNSLLLLVGALAALGMARRRWRPGLSDGPISALNARPSHWMVSPPAWWGPARPFPVGAPVEDARRTLELALSLALLLLTLPLAVVLAALIKLDSPGPILYRQERVGLNGRPFMLIKFRSMHVDAEAFGPCWAAESDPRVTRLGRVLRLTRIDELPQLLNVLSGSMSLVGPRPEQRLHHPRTSF